MRSLLFFVLTLSFSTAAAQGAFNRSGQFDSVVVLTIDDSSLEPFPPGADRTDPVKITGRVKLTAKDVAELHDRLNDRRSYGQSQAVTPVYDVKVQYFKKDVAADEVSISLWTNNLFATFPLNVQRQGECLCEGENGHCCTKGGISMKFKKYLIGLLERNGLPVEKEEILDFGE